MKKEDGANDGKEKTTAVDSAAVGKDKEDATGNKKESNSAAAEAAMPMTTSGDLSIADTDTDNNSRLGSSILSEKQAIAARGRRRGDGVEQALTSSTSSHGSSNNTSILSEKQAIAARQSGGGREVSTSARPTNNRSATKLRDVEPSGSRSAPQTARPGAVSSPGIDSNNNTNNDDDADDLDSGGDVESGTAMSTNASAAAVTVSSTVTASTSSGATNFDGMLVAAELVDESDIMERARKEILQQTVSAQVVSVVEDKDDGENLAAMPFWKRGRNQVKMVILVVLVIVGVVVGFVVGTSQNNPSSDTGPATTSSNPFGDGVSPQQQPTPIPFSTPLPTSTPSVIDTFSDNDRCERAKPVYTDGTLHYGSLSDVNARNITFFDGVTGDVIAVKEELARYYYFKGTGMTVSIDACVDPLSGMNLLPTIYNGDCDSLGLFGEEWNHFEMTIPRPNASDWLCVRYEVRSLPEIDYTTIITGANRNHSAYVFALFSNEVCQYADHVFSSYAGAEEQLKEDLIIGSTEWSTQVDNVQQCGRANVTEAHGLWYRVVGRGSAFTFSTCTGTFVDTQISVYRSLMAFDNNMKTSCDSPTDLVCVTGDDDACGRQSSVSWIGELDETYYVFVSTGGASGATGSFSLSIQDQATHGICEGALTLQTGVQVFDSTASANVFGGWRYLTCSLDLRDRHGVWYRMIGEGLTVRLGILIWMTCSQIFTHMT